MNPPELPTIPNQDPKTRMRILLGMYFTGVLLNRCGAPPSEPKELAKVSDGLAVALLARSGVKF